MTTTSINTTAAKDEWTEIIHRVSHNKERIILVRRDKEVGVIIPMEDWHKLQEMQNQTDLQEAISALKEARSEGTLTLDELNDKIG